MNILALDLAGKTGWAYGSSAPGLDRFASGTVDLRPDDGQPAGLLFLNLWRFLEERHANRAVGAVDVIWYETPHLRGYDPTLVLVGLVSHVLSFAATYRIPTRHLHSASLKKFVTGRGNAQKADVMLAVARRWGSLGWGSVGMDDNEADAIGLLQYARAAGLQSAPRKVARHGQKQRRPKSQGRFLFRTAKL